jgi:hypothetical protein
VCSIGVVRYVQDAGFRHFGSHGWAPFTYEIPCLWSPAGESALGSTVKCCLSLTGGAYFAYRIVVLYQAGRERSPYHGDSWMENQAA